MGSDGEHEGNVGSDGERDRAGQTDRQSDGEADGESGRFEFETYYELFGVAEDATTAEIERAYRELAKQHHPDASELPEEAAERRFRQLLTARDVLTSGERRRAYDKLGHEAYCQQSNPLGDPAGTDGTPVEESDSDPEPRPPGRAQRSARGEALRRGDPVVTTADEAFGEPAPAREGGPASGGGGASDGGDSPASGRGVYGLVFDESPLESRSLQYVAATWSRSWRNRAVVALGGVLLVAAVLVTVPSVSGSVGVDTATPPPTARVLALAGFGVALGHTVYSCAVAELRLPRGQFLADRDHGRFSLSTAASSQRRGVLALVAALVLAIASARNGVDPWAHASDTLGGEFRESFHWFGAPDATWTTPLDVALTGLFAATVVVGTLLVTLGVSITVWRGRYERSVRVRPSIWEPPLVAAVLSAPLALAVGPVGLGRVGPLSAVPETVALAAGIDGTTVTVATVAAAGVVLALASVAVLRVRFALAVDSPGSD